jgi:hypothetical protein
MDNNEDGTNTKVFQLITKLVEQKFQKTLTIEEVTEIFDNMNETTYSTDEYQIAKSLGLYGFNL